MATVANGVVTSLAAGQATITATAGGKTATVTVSVKEATDANYFDFEESTGTITGYSVEGPKDLVIPIKIDGVVVQIIGDWAFADNQLTSVIIPNSVETIGDVAFVNNQLTSVIIPDSVKTIGGSAFFENQLTLLTIGFSVETIGDWAFAGNELTSVIIGSSVETIGRHAFYDNKLTQVTIPESIKTIGEYAFQDNGANSNSNSIPTTDFTGTWNIENNKWVKEVAATLETPTPIAYDGPGGTTGYSNTISLSEAEFTGNTGETMDLSNWTIDTGATNLNVSTITKTGVNSVTIDYTLKVAEQGTGQGTISFIAKAAATTSNADSNQVLVTIAETEEQKDNEDIGAAKTNIEAATYITAQAGADNAEDAKAKAQALVDALELKGATATVVAGTFNAATAGAAGSVDGTDGSYTFTVTIDKGEGTQVTTTQQTMTITATKYEKPALNHEHLSFSGVTNKFTVSAEAPTGIYKIFFGDNNDADETQVNHTTGTWSVSETVQTTVEPGQDIFYTFTEDGKDESSKVQDGTMTLALGDLSGGQELVDGETKNGFNLEYTDDMPASMFKLSGNGIETAVRGTIKIHYEDWSGMTHQDKELTEGASNSTANFDAVEIWADISSELDIQISFIDKVSGNESPLSTLIKLKTQ